MSADMASRNELLGIVARARRRWRLRLALHGAAVLLAAGSVAAIVGGLGVQRLSFSPSAIAVARVALLVVVLALALVYLVLPQLRRADDARFALYLEEHEPSLEAALLSAIEAEPAALSPALLRRLTADAMARVHAVDDGRRVERRRLRVASALLGGTAAALALLLGAGPAPLREGVLALLTPWRSAEAATPFGLEVSPGDVTIPRGADLTVTARPRGFTGARLDLLVRTGSSASFERIPMTAPGSPRDTAAFQAILFDLAQPAEYMVEAGGVRSRLYRVAVADLPYSRKLQLEYHFPAYTALPPRVEDDAGDVAALRGTSVHLRVWTTRPAPSGRILLGDGRAFPLTAASDGTLSGSFPVDRDGLYHLELVGPDGRAVTGSPQYTIDALEDRPPTVSIEKPGRDQSVTSVEEVFIQARASDDYGVGSLELVYRVNGGTEQAVRLYAGSGRALRDVSAGHTLYLEELGLQPGDLVAYYARAADNRPGALAAPVTGPGSDAPGHAASDVYFLQIRPFRKDYRSSDERGMPGGDGQQQDAGQLSEREKQIIAATFNLLRDRPGLSAQEAGEHRTTIALSQQRLREQVQTLIDRMRARGLADDSALAAIVALLPGATREMSAAEGELHAGRESDALPPEQRALQALQRAEALYKDVRVSMSDQQGGGGGASPSASELADLFELEQDKLRNQYETVRRSQEEQTRSQLDAAADRLRQLAQRQQAAAERQRQAGQQGSANGTSGSAGQSQRELAQQAEEEARRLERLAHENPQQPQLEESARQLREAADAMRRAAADPSGAGAQAARDRLDAARRLLEQGRTGRLAQGAADAARRADQLAQEQHRIAGAAASAAGSRPDGARTRQLQEREDQLGAGVQDLEKRLDDLASAAAAASAASDKEKARRLSAAAGMIRDQRIADKIRASRNVIGQRPDAAPYGERLQRDITADLDSLRQRVAAAARAAAGGPDGKDQEAQRTLDRAADLARGMESLGERMRQSAEDAQAGGARADRNGRASNGQQNRQGEQRGGQQAGQPGQLPGQANGGQQGQAGQQAGQGAGQGRPGQSRQPGGRAPGIPGGEGGGDATPPPGGMRGAIPPGEARQFQAEARQRLAQAQALRRDLAARGRPTQELDDVIRRLSALAGNAPYTDPAALQQLQDAAVDGAKRLEFSLRSELRQDARDQVLLSGSGAVPEAYRKLVEQYFKSLSETRDR